MGEALAEAVRLSRPTEHEGTREMRKSSDALDTAALEASSQRA